MRAQVQGMWRDHAGAWHAQKHSAGVGRAVQEQEEGGGGCGQGALADTQLDA